MSSRWGPIDYLGLLLGGIGVALASVGLVGLSDQQARNTDAVRSPCAAAQHPTANVLCIADGEITSLLRRDICPVARNLPAQVKGIGPLKADCKRIGLQVATATAPPSPRPSPSVLVIDVPSPVVVLAPTPTAAPSRTPPAGTGHPTPSATRSRAVGTPSPPASPPPSPRPSPSCAPLARLIGQCR